MAEVRDSRFPYLFNALGLPTDKVMEELSDSFCTRYLTSLSLYDDATVLEELPRIPCRYHYKRGTR